MAGRLVQQAVEKNLKQYIEQNGSTDDIGILSAHNTVKLYDRVIELGGVTRDPDDRKMMSVIREYYYDVNYPGEDCRELTPEESVEAVEFAVRFIGKLWG